jgi:glutaredoxin
VTLYTAADCGLCLEAEEELRRLQQRIRFRLEIVDIASDESVLDRYRERVPVVAVDGREVAAAPLDLRRLRRALSS